MSMLNIFIEIKDVAKIFFGLMLRKTRIPAILRTLSGRFVQDGRLRSAALVKTFPAFMFCVVIALLLAFQFFSVETAGLNSYLERTKIALTFASVLLGYALVFFTCYWDLEYINWKRALDSSS